MAAFIFPGSSLSLLYIIGSHIFIRLCLTWPLMICMKRDISSGHSRRKWKWLKMIFGFLRRRSRRKYKGKKWENKEMRVEINSEKIRFWINSYFLMFMLKSHVDSPDNETLEHIIIVADKLNEAGWCHSGCGNRERSEGTRNRNQRKDRANWNGQQLTSCQ